MAALYTSIQGPRGVQGCSPVEAAWGKRDGGSSHRGKGPLNYKNRCKVPTHRVREETGKQGSDREMGLPVHPTRGVLGPRSALHAQLMGEWGAEVLGTPGTWDLHVPHPGRTGKVR